MTTYKVILDDGSIIGIEAKGYQFNRKDRTIIFKDDNLLICGMFNFNHVIGVAPFDENDVIDEN